VFNDDDDHFTCHYHIIIIIDLIGLVHSYQFVSCCWAKLMIVDTTEVKGWCWQNIRVDDAYHHL